jgi:hypothetical protein
MFLPMIADFLALDFTNESSLSCYDFDLLQSAIMDAIFAIFGSSKTTSR